MPRAAAAERGGQLPRARLRRVHGAEQGRHARLAPPVALPCDRDLHRRRRPRLRAAQPEPGLGARRGAGWLAVHPAVRRAAGGVRGAARPGQAGLAAARDAVAQARRLGFGRRTPIYYDMEAFRPASGSRRCASCRPGPSSCTGSAIPPVSTAAQTPASSTCRGSTPAASTRCRTSSTTRCGTDRRARVTATCAPGSGTEANTPVQRQRDSAVRRAHHQYRQGLPRRAAAGAVATSQATSAVTLPGGAVDLFYRAARRPALVRPLPARLWLGQAGPHHRRSLLGAVGGLDRVGGRRVLHPGRRASVGGLLPADGRLAGRHQLSMMGSSARPRARSRSPTG